MACFEINERYTRIAEKSYCGFLILALHITSAVGNNIAHLMFHFILEVLREVDTFKSKNA